MQIQGPTVVNTINRGTKESFYTCQMVIDAQDWSGSAPDYCKGTAKSPNESTHPPDVGGLQLGITRSKKGSPEDNQQLL